MALQDLPLWEREERIDEIERAVVAVLAARPEGPTRMTELLRSVASEHGWLESEVAVAVSRLGGKHWPGIWS